MSQNPHRRIRQAAAEVSRPRGRRARDSARRRAGVSQRALPPIERIGVTPVEECEAIARAIYAAAAAAAKQHQNTRGRLRLVPSEQETGMIGHR